MVRGGTFSPPQALSASNARYCPMFFKQIKYNGDNFSYVIADEASKEAVVVDPSYNAEAIIRLLKDHDFNVKYVIDTHSHGDHTAGNQDITSVFGAKVVAHKLARVNKGVSVEA